MDENEKILILLEEKVKRHDNELKLYGERLSNVEGVLNINEINRVKDNMTVQSKLDNLTNALENFTQVTNMNLSEINEKLKEREEAEKARVEANKKDWRSVGFDIIKKLLYALIIFLATYSGITIFK